MPFKVCSPEIEFILSALRWIVFDASCPLTLPADRPEIRALNWRKLIKTAREHRVLGFVAYALERNHFFDALAPRVRSILTQSLLEMQWQNKVRRDQFEKFKKFFSEHSIPVAPLKGMALNFRLYQNIPFRPMGDIDLLVREKDLTRAAALLSAQGFTLKQDVTKNRWHDELRGAGGIPFDQVPIGRQSFEIDGLDLDLHWKPVYEIGGKPVGLDMEAAWAGARSDTSGLFLSDVDLAWHLLLHTAALGTNSYLVQLLDIALLMSSWGAETGREIQMRLNALPLPAKKIVGALLRDTQALFAGPLQTPGATDLLAFFLYQIESDSYPRTKQKAPASQTTGPAGGKFRYFAGYFLPNPKYYGAPKNRFRMYLWHWKDLIKTIARVLWRKSQKRCQRDLES